MTDYTELKRLAEAAAQGHWNQDGFEVQNDDIKDYRVACCNRLTDAKFIAAASPAAVLALIAKNERNQRMVLSACMSMGAIGESLGLDMDSDGDEMLGMVAELKTERDQLRAELEKTQLIGRLAYNFDGYKAVLDDRDKLKAENAQFKNQEIELKAEVEALRDDLEQIQYDANAWRNSEESVWIEVFNSEGDDPFISAITGQITVEQLALIQAEILEYREDYFEKGSGLYVFRCAHCEAHYDNVGMTEPAHWETDFESYSPFPWEEEAAAMGKGEQS